VKSVDEFYSDLKVVLWLCNKSMKNNNNISWHQICSAFAKSKKKGKQTT
tara:strand:+ start:37 stop:183 length:147 start_codon:yes stop_codon:yes gene_type:complete